MKTPMAFLLTRRSRPLKMLAPIVPSKEELEPILTAALRVPDHGKLEPWRLVILTRPALARLADEAARYAVQTGADDAAVAKARSQFDESHLAIAVISSPKTQAKVPLSEQVLSAGCVCLGLINAAEASGWGACWLSGWLSHDAGFCARAFGTQAHERLVGLVHIGGATSQPPERPRPDMAVVTQWMTE